jgi:hypothetical protein
LRDKENEKKWLHGRAMSEENTKDIKDILKSIPNDVKDSRKFLHNTPLE